MQPKRTGILNCAIFSISVGLFYILAGLFGMAISQMDGANSEAGIPAALAVSSGVFFELAGAFLLVSYVLGQRVAGIDIAALSVAVFVDLAYLVAMVRFGGEFIQYWPLVSLIVPLLIFIASTYATVYLFKAHSVNGRGS
jgi:hypothetical protein